MYFIMDSNQNMCPSLVRGAYRAALQRCAGEVEEMFREQNTDMALFDETPLDVLQPDGSVAQATQGIYRTYLKSDR
jgi:hypothetical protein